MWRYDLFHTYWDFRIESIAWKLIRKFLHPITIANRLSHTWGKPFHPIRNQLSEWISKFANSFTLVLAPLQSSFTEVCRVSTSLLKFSRKFAINQRQSSNRFIALDKYTKKYIQEEQSKKTRTKTRWDARLACLANFSTEGRGKKSFKKCNIFRKPLSTTTSCTKDHQARKCLKARSKRCKKARQGKPIKGRWSEVNITKNIYTRIWRSGMKTYNNYSMSPSWIWSDKITNERAARAIITSYPTIFLLSKFSNRVLRPIFFPQFYKTSGKKIFKLGALCSIWRKTRTIGS